MPKFLVCSTYSLNENLPSCDYAMILLTEELVTRIEQRAAVLSEVSKQDPDVMEMRFYDVSAVFFSVDDTIDGDDESYQLCETMWSAGREWKEIPRPIPPEWENRTEYDRMVVDVSGQVYWTANPKHSDWTVETTALEVASLRGLLQEKPCE